MLCRACKGTEIWDPDWLITTLRPPASGGLVWIPGALTRMWWPPAEDTAALTRTGRVLTCWRTCWPPGKVTMPVCWPGRKIIACCEGILCPTPVIPAGVNGGFFNKTELFPDDMYEKIGSQDSHFFFETLTHTAHYVSCFNTTWMLWFFQWWNFVKFDWVHFSFKALLRRLRLQIFH